MVSPIPGTVLYRIVVDTQGLGLDPSAPGRTFCEDRLKSARQWGERVMLLVITPRERRALRLLAHRGTEEQVAACFGVRTTKVESSLKALFSRMGVSNASEAIAVASGRGLLEVLRPLKANSDA